MQTKNRNVNLDLLRIFSMFLIVFLHSIDHSGVLEKTETSSIWMYTYVQFTYAFTQICVNCYVLLSGYFLVKSKFRIQKIFAMWIEVAFYSILFKLIFMMLGYIPFSIISLALCLFPIFTGRYWFVTIYVGMYCLSPFLNIFINAMDKKQHTLFNAVMIGLFSVWVSIHPSIAGMNSGRGWGLPWFIVLYFVAAWFRLYYENNREHNLYALMGIIFWVLMMTGVRVFSWRSGISVLQQVVGNWYKYDAFPVFAMTLCIFVLFLNLQIRNENLCFFISRIAPATFGIYLIHAHSEISPWIWGVLNLPDKMNSVWFVIYQSTCVIGIMAGCIVMDCLREKIVREIVNSKTVGEWFVKRRRLNDKS